jgi:integrase
LVAVAREEERRGTPEAERVGLVFPLVRTKPSMVGESMSVTKAICAIGAIGEKAGVIVAKDTETGKVKYASAHDLRRSFGTRWASKVKTPVLQRLMRHRSINTTLKYYVALEADDVAADLWAQHGPDASGNKSGNKRPESAPADEKAESRNDDAVTAYDDASA